MRISESSDWMSSQTCGMPTFQALYCYVGEPSDTARLVDVGYHLDLPTEEQRDSACRYEIHTVSPPVSLTELHRNGASFELSELGFVRAWHEGSVVVAEDDAGCVRYGGRRFNTAELNYLNAYFLASKRKWSDRAPFDFQLDAFDETRPLRILHTEAATTFGGQEHRIYKEMLAMRERGHHLEAIVQPNADLIQRLRDAEFAVHVVAMTGFRNFLAGVHSIARTLRSGGFDIVNTHSRVDTIIAATAARLVQVPLIVRTRHLAKTPGSLLSYTRLPHRVIAVSGHVRDQIIARGAPASKVGLVYTAVELPMEVIRSTLRSELNIPLDAVVIGSVGHMRHQKGHANLIKAAEPLLRSDRSVHLVIAGRGEPLLSQLRAELTNKGLSDQVHLLGQRNDIPNVLSSFDVFALATEIEALGTSFIEAASYGLPLIGTNVGGVPEIIEPGHNGMLVELNDIDQLTNALRTLVVDPKLRLSMGQVAKAMIASDKRWSIAHMARSTEIVYKKWLSEPG